MTDPVTGRQLPSNLIPNPLAEAFASVDSYLSDHHLLHNDSSLSHTLSRSEAAGMPAINVSVTQGKFLQLLSSSIRAKHILELGTLGGYSALCFARSLQEQGVKKAVPHKSGIVSCELNDKWIGVARSNLQQAHVAHLVDIRHGAALSTLQALYHGNHGTVFDLIFLDADKANLAVYLDWSLALSHVNTVIIADNVVRNGRVAYASDDSNVIGAQRFHQRVKEWAKAGVVDVTTLQTVGQKGWDGFSFLRVLKTVRPDDKGVFHIPTTSVSVKAKL